MIDTTKSLIPVTEKMAAHLKNRKLLRSMGIAISGNTLFLRHPYLNGNYRVFIHLNKRLPYLELEQSLPKLLQGHNVFGTNRLQFLCIETTKLIYRQLGIQWNHEEQRIIEARRFKLGRLDITASFITEFPEQVSDIIEAIFEHFRATSHSWSGYAGGGRIGSTYHQQDSARWSAKFYNKGGELKVRELPASLTCRDLFLEYAAQLVRFELTFRAKELKRIGLEYADQWPPSRVIQMLQKHIAAFNFPGAVKSYLEPTELAGLNVGSRTFYRLWRRGVNLRRHHTYPPIRRARETILDQHDVDLYREPRTGCLLPLNEFLTDENAYFVGPKLLTRQGLLVGAGAYR